MNAEFKTIRDIIARARASGRTALDEAAGKALLARVGIHAPRSAVVITPEEGAGHAAKMTGPFVVKVVSPEIMHKSDAGGVILNLAGPADVADAIREMSRRPKIATARVEGWLVEEMIPTGREIVIGGFRDPEFGPMLMVGLGGIFVEVLKDVSFRICPIDRRMAAEMLAELKGHALLAGVRGEAAVNQEPLIDAMLALGGPEGLLVSFADEIAEVDLNPVILSERGMMAADARFILMTEAGQPEAPAPAGAKDPLVEFAPLFFPETVAVLGASTKDVAIANTFIRRLKDFGYTGQIFPIHPKAAEIEGLPAYPAISAAPAPVDYAYIAIGARHIPDVIAEAKGRLKIAQVISSGFGEVAEGRELQADLVAKARIAGVRVIGPNCLGTYSPRGGLTFPAGAPTETGRIGIVSQSGGLSTDIIKRGQWRGLRFSGLVTIGNSADVTPHELVEFYFADPQTRAVGLYIEDIRKGREFFDLLSRYPAPKPVVILKGGRSAHGRAAAASHTGALAGDDSAWDALAAQLPVALVTTIDEFIDALLALQSLELRPGRPTQEVVLFGNGGGSSVLGTDAFAQYGLNVSPFSAEAMAPLAQMGLPPGTSVVNPIDTPVRTLQEKDGWIAGDILGHVLERARPDAIALHLNLAAFVGRGSVDPIGNLFTVIENAIHEYPDIAHFVLALRTDGSAELDERRRQYREKARLIGLPVFDEIAPMARVLSIMGHLERRFAARGQAS
ncbi:acetate--CoA ligase family protein [Paracoccus onubensis]|uniref:acetate--CoA ligase family protein n=1 Tax=Paracoccus onubensis TaxID=1675788 RepID=UPI0027321BA6|nr:acetate--CoA ligase family protein [Paracoccus onubensis]MDP0926185.1 acetate--CoA ligase family protein [Paracoccus onubensis]